MKRRLVKMKGRLRKRVPLSDLPWVRASLARNRVYCERCHTSGEVDFAALEGDVLRAVADFVLRHRGCVSPVHVVA